MMLLSCDINNIPMAPGPGYLHGKFLTLIHFRVDKCNWLYAMFWVVKVLTEHCKYR